MTTKTITITDLADVRVGDIVTADYVPPRRERAARIVGEASQGATGGLMVGGYYLRFEEGAACAALRFVSATREVPAWEPPAELVVAFADNLARLWGSVSGGAVYVTIARQLLGWLHDNSWLKEDPTDTPADPAPVDPVMDETNKRDRIDFDGDRWRWRVDAEVWRMGDHAATGNLAAIDRYYGPLRFADEETDTINNDPT